jgi:hypothetical protein
MEHSVTLYHFVGFDIKVDVEARFENDSLIIDGYDIGKRVEEYWGDSDYEYSLKIPPHGVQQLYGLLGVAEGDQQNLLQELARRFNTNSCFSEIRKLLDDHHIACEGFSWI